MTPEERKQRTAEKKKAWANAHKDRMREIRRDYSRRKVFETSQRAIDEWLKTHRLGSDAFCPVFGSFVKGYPIVMFYNKESEYPYSVQYCGTGRYFKTNDEAFQYMLEREFGQSTSSE